MFLAELVKAVAINKCHIYAICILLLYFWVDKVVDCLSVEFRYFVAAFFRRILVIKFNQLDLPILDGFGFELEVTRGHLVLAYLFKVVKPFKFILNLIT